jgi:hypothetical protein
VGDAFVVADHIGAATLAGVQELAVGAQNAAIDGTASPGLERTADCTEAYARCAAAKVTAHCQQMTTMACYTWTAVAMCRAAAAAATQQFRSLALLD